MTWSQAGSIADVASGIAVIISLIYLSIQIRDNTKAARANAFQGVIRSEMQMAEVFIENAEIWDKVVKGEPIADGGEMRTAIMLYNMFMLDTVRRYRQYSIGYLEAQAWEARRKTLPSIVKLPIFKEWRKSHGAHGQAADFLELLDELASRPDEQ